MPNRRAWVYLNCTLRRIEAKENGPSNRAEVTTEGQGLADASLVVFCTTQLTRLSGLACLTNIAKAILHTPESMPEMAHSSKNHRHAVTIGRFNHFLVPHRASGLNNRRGSGLGDFLDPVWKWKKRVRCRHRAFERKLRLHRTDLARVDPAHLPGADAHRLAVPHI